MTKQKPFFIFLHESGKVRSARSARTYDDSAENYQAITNTEQNRAELRALLVAMEREDGEEVGGSLSSILSVWGYRIDYTDTNPDGSEYADYDNGNGSRLHISEEHAEDEQEA